MTMTDLKVTTESRTRTRWGVTVLFTVTSFFGAGLLFMVQPMVSKLVLPSYGGSATVWSTASLFFQVVLLAAYAWTHVTSRLGPRQPWLQAAVLLLPLLVLPMALPTDAAPGADANQAIWLLRTLTLMIGLPFAVLSCTGPLTQKWYSWTSGAGAEDPYFLYAASNAGSFVGLLSYPFLVEPNLSLAHQRQAWSGGYVLFVALSMACAVVALRSRRPTSDLPRTPEASEHITLKRALTWGALAFVPASLSLAITAHLSTDVPPIPLMWALPLAVYLATFIAAFARRTRKPPIGVARWACALAVVTAGTISTINTGTALTVNLTLLALAGYFAHARLAADRPATAHLTMFYLVVAAGGAAGGLVNGLLAPMLFDRVWEYPMMVALVPMLMIGARNEAGNLISRRYPMVFGAVLVGAVCVAAGITASALSDAQPTMTRALGALGGLVLIALVVRWLAVRPLGVVLALVVVLGIGGHENEAGTIRHLRSFFASYRVVEANGQHQLTNGSTIHGTQFLAPELRHTPTTYYASKGSCEDVFELMQPRLDRVGVVGLGAGTLAAYGFPGERMTFFEVDRDIVHLAEDPSMFSYVSDSAADIDMVVGDGRLKVAEQPDASFDLLVLDAFSSDAIPVHLLTREAMATYASKITDDGVLLVHISNRHFDLEPVLASAARDLGWQASVGHGSHSSPGSFFSEWVAMTPNQQLTDSLRSRTEWQPIETSRYVGWTDDYSALVSVLK
jgi:hypothetical protein